MIIDEVGHAEEFLDRLHHFGGFGSEQLSIQHQDLQGARQIGEVSLAPSPAPLRQENTFTTPLVISEPNLSPACTRTPAKYQCALVLPYTGCWKMKCN